MKRVLILFTLLIAVSQGCTKRSIHNTLIDIELSFGKDLNSRKLYAEKFMDLIIDYDVNTIVGDIYPEYADYAFEKVNKRVLRRK